MVGELGDALMTGIVTVHGCVQSWQEALRRGARRMRASQSLAAVVCGQADRHDALCATAIATHSLVHTLPRMNARIQRTLQNASFTHPIPYAMLCARSVGAARAAGEAVEAVDPFDACAVDAVTCLDLANVWCTATPQTRK